MLVLCSTRRCAIIHLIAEHFSLPPPHHVISLTVMIPFPYKLAKMRLLITGAAIALYLDDVLIKFETIITCLSVDFHQTEMWN